MIIDITRADFIDKDVVETIEDFILHASLKNITVEFKKSQHKKQGFSFKLIENKNSKASLIRNYEKEITISNTY